ncbi:unnamed protein product, partial [Ascophyllum nodosum]
MRKTQEKTRGLQDCALETGDLVLDGVVGTICTLRGWQRSASFMVGEMPTMLFCLIS